MCANVLDCQWPQSLNAAEEISVRGATPWVRERRGHEDARRTRPDRITIVHDYMEIRTITYYMRISLRDKIALQLK